MPIEITVRRDNVDGGAGRKYAEKRATHLSRKLQKVDNVRVVLDRQRHLFEAEFIVEQKGQILAEAREHSDSIAAAIDTAVARIVKQIRKAESKREKAVIQQKRLV